MAPRCNPLCDGISVHTDTGPYRITTLVSCPLYDKAFQYIIDGVNLVRFDRVYFLKPSALPPNNSTINCEDLDPLAGTVSSPSDFWNEPLSVVLFNPHLVPRKSLLLSRVI